MKCPRCSSDTPRLVFGPLTEEVRKDFSCLCPTCYAEIGHPCTEGHTNYTDKRFVPHYDPVTGIHFQHADDKRKYYHQTGESMRWLCPDRNSRWAMTRGQALKALKEKKL